MVPKLYLFEDTGSISSLVSEESSLSVKEPCSLSLFPEGDALNSVCRYNITGVLGVVRWRLQHIMLVHTSKWHLFHCPSYLLLRSAWFALSVCRRFSFRNLCSCWIQTMNVLYIISKQLTYHFVVQCIEFPFEKVLLWHQVLILLLS